MSGSEESLQLFLNGFTARDIAEPLASFDEATPKSTIAAAMADQELSVVGIRKSGKVSGWIAREELNENDEPMWYLSFDASTIVSDTASLNDVIQKLHSTPRLFVRTLGVVGGLIGRNDLQKPAVRMWLFGLMTITELRVTRMIDKVYPEGAWHRYLSEGRLQKAHDLQAERRRRGQDPKLLECLQLADKGQIVARDETLRANTRFASKREVEHFVASLQDLRNNLAHAQDISGDWEIIHDLATNLHRIVLGPNDHGVY